MQKIKDIHARAVELWVHRKRVEPDSNPSAAIIFALTDSTRPSNVPEPENTVELCEAINQIKGWPPLNDGERKAIDAAGILAYEAQERGSGSINQVLKLIWANRIGYLLGCVALIVAGFSWWILGLLVATWWAMGAARMCVQFQRTEGRPSWELPVHILIHMACLVGLYAISIYRIIQRVTA